MPAKVATACDESQCTELLVRGDKVSFVSLEQAEEVGCYSPSCDLHRDDEAMPSDIDTIPKDFVLVHDTEAAILPKCELYVLRWRGTRRDASGALPSAVTEYFGKERPRSGGVEIPDGPWKKVCKVRFIRYTRYGVAVDPEDKTKIVMRSGGKIPFEHGYDPPVDLHVCKRPLAWKLSLPDSCVITAHGFISP